PVRSCAVRQGYGYRRTKTPTLPIHNTASPERRGPPSAEATEPRPPTPILRAKLRKPWQSTTSSMRNPTKNPNPARSHTKRRKKRENSEKRRVGKKKKRRNRREIKKE